MFRKAVPMSVVLILLAGVPACSDDPLAPFQPEISNLPDSFQLQATGVVNRTATLNYTWSNSGTQATVDHSTTTSAGNARVIIKDGAGAFVYNALLAPSLNETTATGASGDWNVQLVLDGYSGTLNFRVQTATP